MLGCQRLHAVDGEDKLEIQRLLGPQRPVVIEGGDPLWLKHEVRRVVPGDLADEVDDGGLRGPITPGRERVCGMRDR